MSNQELTEKRCRACEGTEEPLQKDQISGYLAQAQGWTVSHDNTLLFKEYKMKSFMDAVAFIQQLAAVAEAEGHHPDLHLTNYKELRIELSTHAIGGLSENDFIIAAKINEIPSAGK